MRLREEARDGGGDTERFGPGREKAAEALKQNGELAAGLARAVREAAGAAAAAPAAPLEAVA